MPQLEHSNIDDQCRIKLLSNEHSESIKEGPTDCYNICNQYHGGGVMYSSNHTHSNFNNNCVNSDNHERTMTDIHKCAVNNNFCLPVEGCSNSTMFAISYDSQGNQSHLLWDNMSGDHSHTSDHRMGINKVGSTRSVTLTFLSGDTLDFDQWGSTVYIQDPELEVKGYYKFTESKIGSHWDLFGCGHLPEGYLKVTGNLDCKIMKIQHRNYKECADIETNARLAYDDYCRELKSWQKYGCSYDTRMIQVIDQLIQTEGKYDTFCDQMNSHDLEYKDMTCGSDIQGRDIHYESNVKMDPNLGRQRIDRRLVKDFNYPDKTTGYLAQDSTNFTFIGPDRRPVKIDSVETLLKVAEVIRNTGQPNYKAARIPIESDLNIEAWERYLRDYSDKRVIQYIKFGFPLSLNDPHELNNTKVTNHFSACQYPQQVQEYIDKEMELGALLGPVDDIIDSNFHCSPLLTRPKDNNKRRVILNLSHPYGHSVNSHVDATRFDGSPFILKFPTVDDIAGDINKSTEDILLFKVDIARAFRNLRADPSDSLKFGISWRNTFYVDVGIAFGWTHGSASFQLLSDAVAYIMSKEGITLRCYIDDYIAVVPKSKADTAFRKLCEVLSELGLPINRDKLTPPTKRLTCLGIDFDIENNIMRISEDKLQAIHAECIDVSTRTSLSKRKYQSLLGKLLYIQKCVKPARVFINRLLSVFRSNSHLKTIPLSQDFHKDIQWFLTFLPSYNGVSYIQKHKVDSGQSLYLDACLTGMGAVWRNRVYATPIHNCGDMDLKIIHLEMLNIVIALRTWGVYWRHSDIDIFCDNLGVVQVVETGKTRDQFLALCVRNIWLLTAVLDIQLNIYHVPGVHNVIADTLSRIYSKKLVNKDILQVLQDNYIWDHIPSQHF